MRGHLHLAHRPDADGRNGQDETQIRAVLAEDDETMRRSLREPLNGAKGIQVAPRRASFRPQHETCTG